MLVLRPARAKGRFVAGGKLGRFLFPARSGRNDSNRDRCLNLGVALHVGARCRKCCKSDGQDSVDHCVTSLLAVSG